MVTDTPTNDLTYVWVTKDKRELEPHQFGDGHLLNTIAMVERMIKRVEKEDEQDAFSTEHSESGMAPLRHLIRGWETNAGTGELFHLCGLKRALKNEAITRGLIEART